MIRDYRLQLVAVVVLALAAGGCSTLAPAGPGASDAAPEALENSIKWSTASEVDNFGYDVYRALGEDGPWDRVTSEAIEGAGTTDEPSHYRFADDTIEPGTTYYYYVESISMSGARKRFTPIAKAPPKMAPEVEQQGCPVAWKPWRCERLRWTPVL